MLAALGQGGSFGLGILNCHWSAPIWIWGGWSVMLQRHLVACHSFVFISTQEGQILRQAFSYKPHRNPTFVCLPSGSKISRQLLGIDSSLTPGHRTLNGRKQRKNPA